MIKEYPYASMEKDQLISMKHFLVKREEERAQENQELKDMVRELRETRNSLMKSVDLLSKQLADSSNEKAALLQKIDDLMSMISVNNKARFGSKSQKGTKKKATPVQDREKDKDEFDGTNGAAMSTVSQAEPVSEEPTEQPERDYEYRKGMKYQTMYADNRILHESDRSLLPEGATIIKSVYESTYEQVSYIVQHDYETWCRVKVNGKYGKKYIWGMVNEDADYFISLIAMLYELEKEYRLRHLTTEQIRQERQGEKTAKIIHQLRQRLDKLLADSSGMRGKLMQGALAYMNKYWDQLFLYLKDGRYNIDRSALSLGLSKNSDLRFSSKDFEKLWFLLPQGRKNLLPMTIGLKRY